MPSCYTRKKGLSSTGKQRYEPDPKRYLFNIDTFWFNIDADNYDDVMRDWLLDRLASGRQSLDDGESRFISVKLPTYDNELIFEIGFGQYPLYQYSLRNEDIAIYLSKQSRQNDMPIRVQINQFLLWEKGLKSAYSEALNVLMSLGFAVGQAKLNRVDFACHSDQFNWTLDDLKTFDYPRNFADDNKPNFVKLCPITGEFETVYYGNRKRVQLRIYNKSKEIIARGKHHFSEMYERLGMDIDNVWNVEIEVRRDFIKDLKDVFGNRLFDDVDKIIDDNLLSELWSYLMEMYTHKSAHWTVISKGAYGKFEKLEHTVQRVKDIDWTTEREVAQIYGRLQKFLINSEYETLDMALREFLRKASDYEDKKERDFEKEVIKKRQLYHDDTINRLVKKIGNKNLRDKTMADLPDWAIEMFLKNGKILENGIIKSAAEKQQSAKNKVNSIISDI